MTGILFFLIIVNNESKTESLLNIGNDILFIDQNEVKTEY